jgi:hypothetical protein
MTPEFRKEAYRRFWMIKGHLGCDSWQDKDIVSMHDSYLFRLWHNEEAYRYEEGFEEAWEALMKSKGEYNERS